MVKYLLYIRYALSGQKVYEVETSDIYHVIGRAFCCSIEKIEWVNFVIDESIHREFWAEEGITIRPCPRGWLPEEEVNE